MVAKIEEAILIAENVKVSLESLHFALSHPLFLIRNRAREQIVNDVIAGLSSEDREKLEAYGK
jgi:hypothetical protein